MGQSNVNFGGVKCKPADWVQCRENLDMLTLYIDAQLHIYTKYMEPEDYSIRISIRTACTRNRRPSIHACPA